MIYTLVFKYTSYISFIIFVIGIAYKWWKWSSMPLHLRWELYPVPHEVLKAEYGGSYLEEVNWWLKGRLVSVLGELKEMFKEMLFIVRIYRSNKRLWLLSYSFHLGIYLVLIWFILIFLGAITITYIGIPIPSMNPWAIFVYYATIIIGIVGDVIAIVGGLGLLVRRLVSPVLRDYTTIPDYLNLILVLLALMSGLSAWFFDLSFNLAREFMSSLINPLLPPPYLNVITIVHLAIVQILIAYIPFSKITHFIGKYFTYHKVLWDDEPNMGQLDGKIRELLKLKLSWSDPHIKSGDTWINNALG